ncbi:MAG: hypothetical protein A3F13_02565 [Gammaproteobacteria bacterium RIFCSPHIGHO2_12_FULL_40_19]|nr:MAG: hypothetical protein A3F13_02565 [Gammaproteobacteria bacterium RIFCSPHIGHO2_12_FULL_40_19]
MKKILFALALLCAYQGHADETSWKQDFLKIIDAEHYILEEIPVHPHRKIVLCMLFPSQHYSAYKTRLSNDRKHILTYVHLKYDEAKKFFPWLKFHKKSYLNPLKGYKFRVPKDQYIPEIEPQPEVQEEQPIQEVPDDVSPGDGHFDGEPDPDFFE